MDSLDFLLEVFITIFSGFFNFVFNVFEVVPGSSYGALVLGSYILIMLIRFLVAIPSMSGGSKREKGSRGSKSSSNSSDEQ